MHFVKVSAALALLSATAYGQANNLPSCSLQCFAEAIGASSCSALDSLCQCTTGSEQITADVTSCLCTSTCTLAELASVQSITNGICSSALSAEGSSYSARTADPNACATGASGSSSTGAAAAPTTASEEDGSSMTDMSSSMPTSTPTQTSEEDGGSPTTSAIVEEFTGGASRADVAKGAAVAMLGLVAGMV